MSSGAGTLRTRRVARLIASQWWCGPGARPRSGALPAPASSGAWHDPEEDHQPSHLGPRGARPPFGEVVPAEWVRAGPVHTRPDPLSARRHGAPTDRRPRILLRPAGGEAVLRRGATAEWCGP